jgi:hypothetical protein
MTAVTEFQAAIESSFAKADYQAGDPEGLAARMLAESRKLGLLAMSMASEIAADPAIGPGEAARQAAMLAEETAAAAERMELRHRAIATMAGSD